MKIVNRPMCAKCNENPAFLHLAGRWICGDCANKYLKKVQELNEKILFEE